MSAELIAYYRAIVEADGIDKARETFNANVAAIQAEVVKAHDLANRKDWTEFQRKAYLRNIVNGVNTQIAAMRPVGRAYLRIAI